MYDYHNGLSCVPVTDQAPRVFGLKLSEGHKSGIKFLGRSIKYCRVGKIAEFLVINRVRVLGSGLHTLAQFFWEYPPRYSPIEAPTYEIQDTESRPDHSIIKSIVVIIVVIIIIINYNL